MRPVIRELLWSTSEHHGWFNDWVLFHKGRRRAGQETCSRMGLIPALARQRLNLMLLLSNSFWTAAVSKFAGVGRVVGYARDRRSWLLHDAVDVPRDGTQLKPVSAVDYYLKLADRVGCPTDDRRMQLYLSSSENELGQRFWRTMHLDDCRRTVVINSNAAADTSKIWPAEYVSELAGRLVSEQDCQVVLHCGPGERDAANAMAARTNHPRVVSMGQQEQLPVGLSKAVLARADVVVSTDSGPRHIAVCLDRPVVSLFGSTEQAWTRTYNVPETMLSQSLDCRPCYARKCPLGHHRCMSELSVDRVLAAVAGRLSTVSAAA